MEGSVYNKVYEWQCSYIAIFKNTKHTGSTIHTPCLSDSAPKSSDKIAGTNARREEATATAMVVNIKQKKKFLQDNKKLPSCRNH